MWNPLLDPSIPIGTQVDQIETVIVPRARDLGGFEVRRALPSAQRQMVGPFIFFDQMGPAEFLTGQGIDVRPHPHIGLGTVTYLLKGKMHHRDSLGTDLWIEPGAVNWMMAGQGITHSERTDGEARKAPLSLFGLQTWLALPKDREEDAAGFAHLERAALPELEGEGKQVRLILGTAWGEKVGLDMPSEVFYADARLQPGASIPLPDDHEDRGVYILDGEISCAGQTFEAGRMLVFRPGDRVSVKAGPQGARIMLLGGATMDGPRFIWWNFVASSKEKIDAAREAWRAGDWMHGRFKLPPHDDDEFIPAPER
ncbi:pirin family protein [Tabrizicola sp.]|uniref:pirin family protein n=1 Tax=Tabrizicola sp. TaxID=2005166 RepID=UPI0027336EF2|nr:pirin family protein [Tabrizicola sp.]MDP3194546.1 pirin family protein [Tabrizicola sp.]